MSKRSKNPSPVMYFTSAVDDAIVRYLAEPDQVKRDAIFNDFIYWPFFKLAENIFNTFKFSYFDDHNENIMKDCVRHMTSALDKYDPTMESKKFPGQKVKAFGYFSTIAKNFLIYHNNKEYARRKRTQTLNVDEDHIDHTESEIHQAMEDFGPNNNDTSHEDYVKSKREFFDNLCEWSLTANIPTNHVRMLHRVKNLIDGTEPFVVHASNRKAPSLRKSLGGYGSLVALRKTIEKYEKYLRSTGVVKTVLVRPQTAYKHRTSSKDYVTHRKCPSCGKTIIHTGKLAKYQCHYANLKQRRCYNCCRRYLTMEQQ